MDRKPKSIHDQKTQQRHRERFCTAYYVKVCQSTGMVGAMQAARDELPTDQEHRDRIGKGMQQQPNWR